MKEIYSLPRIIMKIQTEIKRTYTKYTSINRSIPGYKESVESPIVCFLDPLLLVHLEEPTYHSYKLPFFGSWFIFKSLILGFQ
jgi:hypothetical protein